MMRVTIAMGWLLGSLALVLGIMVLGAGPASAQTVSPGVDSVNQPGGGGGPLSGQDRRFMTQNAQTDLAEIAVGKLVAQRGTTAAIRQTAQTLASDHQRVLSELQGIAKAKSVTLPTTPNAMQLQVASRLKSATGTAFDQLYKTSGIAGHQQSIQGTQQEISSGSDAQVKQFATNYLPVAQKHLQMLQQLSNQNAPK